MGEPNNRTAVNGKYYSFVDIELDIGGLTTSEFTAISYKNTINRSKMRGSHPQELGRTRGEIEGDASIELFKSAHAAWIASLGDGYMEQMFDITVSYELEDGTMVTDVIVRCQMKESANDHKVGPDGLTVSVPLDIDHVIENGKRPFLGMRA